jgi:hypothetical protein
MRFVDGTESDVVMSTIQMILSVIPTAAVLIENQRNDLVIQTVNQEVKNITGFTPGRSRKLFGKLRTIDDIDRECRTLTLP